MLGQLVTVARSVFSPVMRGPAVRAGACICLRDRPAAVAAQPALLLVLAPMLAAQCCYVQVLVPQVLAAPSRSRAGLVLLAMVAMWTFQVPVLEQVALVGNSACRLAWPKIPAVLFQYPLVHRVLVQPVPSVLLVAQLLFVLVRPMTPMVVASL